MLAETAVPAEKLVEPLLGLLRLLWRGFAETGLVERRGHSVLDLTAELRKQCPETPPELCEAIISAWLRSGAVRAKRFSFAALAGAVCPSETGLRDLTYFAIRSLRKRHAIGISAETAHNLHELAAAASRLIEQFAGDSIPYVSELEPALDRALAGSGTQLVRAYVRACQVLDLAEPEEGGNVRLRREAADPAFLLSHLFGMPTTIPGFDDLFSGGGLMLADDAAENSADEEVSIGGRAIVCAGPFGSGKSLLALQFAREVALKGGVAWVVALEQTPQECLYSLESLGIDTKHSSFTVVRGLTESFVALGNPSPSAGALVFLRPTEETGSYSEFLKTLKTRLSWMSNYPLRLLVIDPVNAFFHPKENDEDIRALTRQVFEAAKRAQVNIWFNSEQLSSSALRYRFEENVADTVIHLGWKTALGQQRRSIEVIKSRFQPEQSGRHGLAIEPGGGVRVYPSSAAIARGALSRIEPTNQTPISLGIPGLDRLLGTDHLNGGDIVALGGRGKGKTLLGIQYLLGYSEHEGQGGSVFISDYAALRIERFLATVPSALMHRRASEVEMCSVPTGFVDPGSVLEGVKTVLRSAKSRFGFVRRIVVSNLGRWEQEMPFLAADVTFGMALTQLLRDSQAACVVVCGDSLDRGVRLIDTMFDQANFMLEFGWHPRQGRSTTLVTAIKTKQMQHAREEFELEVSPKGLQLKAAPPVRQSGSGEVKPLPISLFLHAETRNHREQNERMVTSLRATISPGVQIQDQSRGFDPSLLAISEFSAVDELQIFQIDEFQLPTAKSCSEPPSILFSFSAKSNSNMLEGRLPELCRAAMLPGSDRVLAVPFYANLSFFALERSHVGAAWKEMGITAWPDSWEELARICVRWEKLHPESENPELAFFACPIYNRSVETLNCLFFEILQTMHPAGSAERDDISLWLDRPEALQALWILRTLYRRSHLWQRKHRGDKTENEAISRALITRHWYNTLNQELSEHSGEELDIEVKPLFGGVSTAGEWYLAIPAHSASPEIGLRLIEYLTMSDRETDRVELGVGLPTRIEYYASEQASISRYFDFSRANVYRLMQKALRRSEFRGYQRLSRTISTHLEWAIEIAAGPSESNVQLELQRMMKSLVENAKFVLGSRPSGSDRS